jgi:hypothetical protein
LPQVWALPTGLTHFGGGRLAASLHEGLNHPAGRAEFAADPIARSVFDQTLHWSFLCVVTVAVLTFVPTWLIPIGSRPGDKASGDMKVRQAA